jgi:hypothetical protein
MALGRSVIKVGGKIRKPVNSSKEINLLTILKKKARHKPGEKQVIKILTGTTNRAHEVHRRADLLSIPERVVAAIVKA